MSLTALRIAGLLSLLVCGASARPAEPVDAGEPFGKLPLVDEVRCGEGGDDHDFTEDPKGATEVRAVLGRPCRVMPSRDGDGPRHFSYLLGKGKGLKAGAAYVLSVEFPEDVPRTMFLLNRGCEATRGFSTGAALGDVLYTYTDNNVESVKVPLSGTYRSWRMLFHLHDRFPDVSQPRGAGPRPSRPADGFRVVIAQAARKSAPLSAGAAVARVRLFAVDDPSRFDLPVRLPPAPLPRRRLFWREEMSDGVVASTRPQERGLDDETAWFEHQARRMRFLGVNTFCKDLLEFGHNQGWDASPFGGDDWYWASKQPQRWRNILQMVRRYGFDVLPYYEWAGGTGRKGLGRQKRCVPLGGGAAYTHITWSEKLYADVTDPEALADAKDLLTATILRHKDEARFAGAWFRTRPSHLPMSFADACLARFEQEARPGRKVTREALRADRGLLEKYYAWWYQKRRAFLAALREHLRSGLGGEPVVLFTAYGAEPGPAIHGHQQRVVTDDVETWQAILSRPPHQGRSAYPLSKAIEGAEHLAAALRPPQTWGKWEWQHSLPPPDPASYRQTPGVLMTMPFNRMYTVSGEGIFDAFRGPAGLAVARHYPLNENALDKKLGYFVSDVERAGPYCMLAEARAVAFGDPTHVGYLTAASFHRGFPEHVRAFNAAFLALPALPSRRLPDAASRPGVAVRAIETKAHGTYLAVVNVGLKPVEAVTVTLPRAGRVTDAATGRALAADGRSVRLGLGPCELRALHIE